ncbi:MAG: hypothetical protein RQ847_08900 [Wenzhouxiangellaceae bacterium]|nr:hypothetical protein [Wenzhouxiangellaceae bacterium]
MMKPVLTWMPAVALSLVLAACSTGPRTLRLAPPRLEIESVQLDGDQARIIVLLHNPNDHAVIIDRAHLAMRIGEDELFNAEWQLGLDVSPRNRERVPLEAPARQPAAATLAALDRSSRPNLTYTLTSELSIRNQRDMRAKQDGYLHPVPGQLGHYR